MVFLRARLSPKHHKASKALAGWAVIFSTLVISTQAAKAAIFTVQFSGQVDSLVTERGNDRFGPPFQEEVESLLTENTNRNITDADLLTGQYRFDDVSGEVVSAQLRFIAPGSALSSDLSEPSVSDLLFAPVPPPPNTPDFPKVSSSSRADRSSTVYELRRVTADTFNGNRFSLSADQTFLYLEGFSQRGGSYRNTYVRGSISSLKVLEDPDTTPTSVPEPAVGLGGLLLLAVSGYFLRDRTPSASAPSSFKTI